MDNLELFKTEQTTKILLELGVPANLQGFRCLKACILKVIDDPSVLRKVTKDLYPQIGKQFAIASSVVERSMRHSTEIAFNKTGFKFLSNLFGTNTKWNYKPTNSELIALIAEYIGLQIEKKKIKEVK